MMKRICFALAASMVLLLSLGADLHAGDGDVTVKISNSKGGKYDNKVVIGETNTLEIWIANSELIKGASWGFEIEFDAEHEWIMDSDKKDSLPLIEELNRAEDAFNMPGLMVKCVFDNGKYDSLLLGGASMNGGFKAGDSELAYSLEFKIPDGAKPRAKGVCVKPIFYPPAGTWTATESDGGYAPSFNGQPTLSQAKPRAKAACFDIVKAK